MRDDVNARRAEVRRRYRRGRPSITTLRIAELARIFRARYGERLPDDDAGRDDARILLAHLARLSGDLAARARAFRQQWAPWLSVAELTGMLEDVTTAQRSYGANELGRLLRLTDAERAALNVRTIAPCDVSKRQRAERQRERKRQRDKARRRAAGSKPRAQYEAQSIERQKPWKAAGMSRATWYRQTSSRNETSPRHV